MSTTGMEKWNWEKAVLTWANAAVQVAVFVLFAIKEASRIVAFFFFACIIGLITIQQLFPDYSYIVIFISTLFALFLSFLSLLRNIRPRPYAFWSAQWQLARRMLSGRPADTPMTVDSDTGTDTTHDLRRRTSGTLSVPGVPAVHVAD